VGSHITGGRLIRVPSVISHVDAVEAVIAAPNPTRRNHPPSPTSNNLSHTNALVSESPRKLVVIRTHDYNSRAHYLAGCGSGLVTGSGSLGTLLGGGGISGSAVGVTDSSSGMTV